MPNARLLFIINLATVLAVVAFAAGVVYVLLRRGYRRRVEEQKLAAMGTATARILHQIKNPLQTILLHADLLQDAQVVQDATARREVCEAIVSEAQRLAAMVAELSIYASGARRALHPEPLALHTLVRELGRNASRHERLRVDVSRVEETTVLADPYYLRQALENLIANARDAMEGQADAWLALRVVPGDGVVAVEVEDSGPGIPPDRLATLFQPFVSGKGKGMGLGLAICREIVEGHGGRIEVESRPGTGTRFRVILPGYEPAAARDNGAVLGGVS